jgi:TonB family protein
MELLIWAGKVSLYWLFFYGLFHFFLKNLTLFSWNRAYLLLSLLVSMGLPFVSFSSVTTAPIAAYTVQLDPFSILNVAETTDRISWLKVAGALYAIVVAFLFLQFVAKLLKFRQIWRRSLRIDMGTILIHLLPDDAIPSFSFLNKIAISQTDYADHFDEILSHEIVHVQQRHTLDILLVEVLRIFFWFHPALPAYKKSLQEIHEFLADAKSRDRDTYAEFLVTYSLGIPKMSLVNSFYNASLLKQRIQMLYKNKSSKWKVALYPAMGLLTFALVLFVAACSKPDDETENSPQFRFDPPQIVANADTTADPIFTAVEENPEFQGGVLAMYKFLGENIKYPLPASRANVSGRVFAQFVVKTDGSISDVTVLKGIGFGCDEEAIRVLKSMPKWNPGKQGGKAVNVRYTLPINFELENSEEPTASTLVGEPKPLIVVNGVIIDPSSQSVPKAENIESVNVLKDHSATALYGEKGANGVIEITLKD